MSDWREVALSLGGCDDVRDLQVSAAPAWVWSQDGERLLWCNAAAGAILGATRFAELSERRWPPHDPLRRDLHNLGRALTDAPALARLRIAAGIDRLPITCRVRRIRSALGLRGLLVVSLGSPAVATVDQATFLEFAESTGREPQQDREAAPPARPTATPLPGPASAPPAGQVSAPPVAAAEPPVAADKAAAWDKVAEELPDWVRAGFDLPRTETGHPPELRLVPPAGSPPPAASVSMPERAVSAGRVEHDLSRKPVRFLWQTDAADRFLFVSPGLGQVVGRNAEIVGERWLDAADRLRLDPAGRIAAALNQRDTWSGQTAWWPIEGSGVRVPAELTALPVFGGDHSFQGYRGFGVLRPAEALMPAAFDTRYRADTPPSAVPAAPAATGDAAPANVVPIRADLDRAQDLTQLSPQERIAFEEIAASLRERIGEVVPDRGTAIAARSLPSSPPAAVIEVEERPAAPPEPRPAALETTKPAEPPQLSHQPQPPGRVEPGPSTSVQPDTEPASREFPASRVAPNPDPAPRRQRDDEDLQRRLGEMTAILDTATDGILILDSVGTIENANASAEALFGMEAAELHGMLFVDLLTEDSRVTALDYLGGLKDHGVASLLNEGREVEAKAGARAMPLFMTLGRISSDNGGRFCALLRDMTHWKRTEADLVAARRKAESASSQKSDFLARVSHEIRTPLNAVIGFAEVMIEERFGAIGNDRYREYLRDIRMSGEHVVSLVNDLLDISKIEAGKLDLSFVAVPLNELVRECITLMQPQAGRGQVVLRSSLSREVPGIVADERTMRQIVLNLLSNSVKFTAPGGQVIASTSLAESGEAVLRVRDTGEGMSEEELARALEPFRQISTSTMGNRSGTGLGLPLTKALVEANRASFEIRSAPGEGTVVKVTFPPTRVLSE